MERTFDESIVSDLHKDARGFRPSAGWWAQWKSMDDAGKQAEWDALCEEMDGELERERAARAAALVRWTSHIDQLMADNLIDRATAIRWDMQAAEADGDAGFYCYHWGLSYDLEAEINRVLEEGVPA